MPSKHAKKAPSAASRWMVCGGCINFCEGIPEPESSIEAKEGTAAHKLAEKILLSPPGASFIDEVIEVEGAKFTVDQEMEDAVMVYVDAIKTDVASCKPTSITTNVEKKFDLSWLSKDMFGTNDFSLFDRDIKLLRIYDYKHGQGIFVEAEWNEQLMIYGLGGLIDAWDIDDFLPIEASVESVELVVVQPRIECDDGFVRRWIISTSDLLYWGINVLKPCALRTEDPEAKRIPGNHCRFCRGSAVCPEKIQAMCALAKTDFKNPILPKPQDITPVQLADIAEKAAMFNGWMKAVNEYTFNEMLRGVKIPGQKLVKKKSNRVWADGGEQSIVESLGDDAYAARKVLSVAQAEKVLKAKGMSIEAEMEGLVDKPDTGVTMAAEDDRRKEVDPPAVTDFEEINELL